MLTHQELLAELHKLVIVNGSQLAAAKALGISHAYFHEVLTASKAPGKKILDALNLERVCMYRTKILELETAHALTYNGTRWKE